MLRRCSRSGLQAWYGESHVLHGVTFDVRAGEFVTLLGRNGAGRPRRCARSWASSVKRTGSVRFDGRELIGLSSDRHRPPGLGVLSRGARHFCSLNVQENLLLPPKVQAGGLELEQIFELFPNLQERLSSQGHQVSGGEQQMLAMAAFCAPVRACYCWTNRTEGLAPVITIRSARPSAS